MLFFCKFCILLKNTTTGAHWILIEMMESLVDAFKKRTGKLESMSCSVDRSPTWDSCSISNYCFTKIYKVFASTLENYQNPGKSTSKLKKLTTVSGKHWQKRLQKGSKIIMGWCFARNSWTFPVLRWEFHDPLCVDKVQAGAS